MWNKDKALTFVIDYLKGKLYTKVMIATRNKFGHAFIKTDQGSFYWLYKKDHFHSFNYEFPDYIKKPNTLSGAGESINVEYLKFALNNNATLLFSYGHLPRAIYTPSREKLLSLLHTVMPEANFQNTPPIALLKIYCKHYKLKRTQERINEYKANDYTENPIKVQEKTYSFPFKLMERFLGKPKNVQ